MAEGVPLQQVVALRQQGLSDNQVIQTLQSQGFGSQQIFDAMSQADVGALPPDEHGSPVPGAPPGAFPPQPPPAAAQEPLPPPPQDMAPQPPMQEQYQDYGQYQYPPQDTDEKVEEVVEAMINEKWEELAKEVSKITEWKGKMETQVQKVSDALDNMKEDVNQLRQGVLGKIHEYDENMRNVGADLQAVQKVFKEVIPEFTKNVAELGRMTKSSKSKK